MVLGIMAPGHRYLKVFANEKRGGLRVVLFDRSSFKLFSLKFSDKMVQAPWSILWEAENHSANPVSIICKQ